MNFIKRIFKKAFAFTVKHFTKVVCFAADLIRPLVTSLSTSGKSVTWTEIGKAICGIAIAVVVGNVTNALCVLALTALTMLFGLILPILLANLIALALVVIGVVYFYIHVVDSIEAHYQAARFAI